MTLRPAHELEELARLGRGFDAGHQLRQRDDLCAKNFRLEAAAMDNKGMVARYRLLFTHAYLTK